MRLRQLMEGQTEQIAGLRPSAPVALFYPTDMEGAEELFQQSKRSSADQELLVFPSLKTAARVSDVIVKFYSQGKSLYAPREVERNRRDKAIAAQKYPESFRPEVSFSMLSQRPMAIFNGPFSVGNVDGIFVMKDGRPEKISVREFVKALVDLRAAQRRG